MTTVDLGTVRALLCRSLDVGESSLEHAEQVAAHVPGLLALVNEQAAELAEAREQVSVLRVESKQHLRDYKASLQQIGQQLDEASRRREEDGRHLLKLFKDREHDRDRLAWLGGQVQSLRGLCDGMARMDGYDPETAYVTVREIRRIIDMQPTALCLRCGGLEGTHTRRGCAEVGTVPAQLDPAVEEAHSQRLDAEAAAIEARAVAERRVLDAAEAWRGEFPATLTALADDCYTPQECELFAAVDARRALTGAEGGA